MSIPRNPKIYHIVHQDRLTSIIANRQLVCDAEIQRRQQSDPNKALGTAIGYSHIKQRRLTELTLPSYPDLYVGQCVPFYFCPRPVMLYVIHKNTSQQLSYSEGQTPIVHLEADLHATVKWADAAGLRWAFTLSNAGATYFEDRTDLAQLDELRWAAIQARSWQSHKDQKQAEFLVEKSFSWHLVDKIGVASEQVLKYVNERLLQADHKPTVEIASNWYY